eukprot:4927467-Pleurochrysis_carterae.AAC.1
MPASLSVARSTPSLPFILDVRVKWLNVQYWPEFLLVGKPSVSCGRRLNLHAPDITARDKYG